MTRIPKILHRALRHVQGFGSRRTHYNVNRIKETGKEKRALLLYKTFPVRLSRFFSAVSSHQNTGQSQLIAQMLGAWGYIVDVMDVGRSSFELHHTYDLVLSHRVGMSDLEAASHSDTIKIYLATGMDHVMHNQNLKRRLLQFKTRHPGHELVQLIWDEESMPFLDQADAIAAFGNDVTALSWQNHFKGPIYPFNNYGLPSLTFQSKSWETARRHFLFFGSGQQLGKGLDLLLDVFARNPSLHLYVCGRYERESDFCEAYHRELFHTPNIHPCGWVPVDSPRFNKLIRTCAFGVLPSCSEGQPGSITNLMYAGVVPLLTREAGISVGDFGFLFANDSVDEIEKMVLNLSTALPEEVERCAIRTRQVAQRDYSREAFVARWRFILDDIHRKFGKTTPTSAL